jgi:isocitrate dehydrogenase
MPLGANRGDQAAVFEAAYGAAPKYANQDAINPGSQILSRAMMFDYLGWGKVAKRIVKALEKTISEETFTYDQPR